MTDRAKKGAALVPQGRPGKRPLAKRSYSKSVGSSYKRTNRRSKRK